MKKTHSKSSNLDLNTVAVLGLSLLLLLRLAKKTWLSHTGLELIVLISDDRCVTMPATAEGASTRTVVTTNGGLLHSVVWCNALGHVSVSLMLSLYVEELIQKVLWGNAKRNAR